MMHFFKRVLFWISWPALFVYLVSGSRSRVLLVDGDKVLLVKGRWSWLYGDIRYELPGGGIKRHENPVQAALRELTEELGITLNTKDLRFLQKTQIRQGGLQYTAQFFVAEISQATLLHLQSKEIVEASWLLINDLDAKAIKPEVQAALQAWSNPSGLVQ